MTRTMEDITQASSPSFAFSHPIQAEWGEQDVPEVAIHSLDERFRGTIVHPGDVLGPLAMVTKYVTRHRIKLEHEHARKTFLTNADFVKYQELAGNDSRVVELVEHFASCAIRSLMEDPTPSSDRSINLGGNRQYGLMNATDITDGMSTHLKEKLLSKYGTHSVKPYERHEHDLLRYRFEYYYPGGRLPNDEPQFAIITRRRPVLDFDKRLRVFKESVGLIVMKNLPRDTVNRIHQDMVDYHDTVETIKYMEGKQIMPKHDHVEPFSEYDLDHLNFLRTVAKLAFPTAGGIFERAIERHDDTTTDVLPISADYIMRIKKEDL